MNSKIRCGHDVVRYCGFTLFTALLSIATCLLTGCVTDRYAITGGGTPPPVGYAYLTGNWVLKATQTSGAASFTTLSGYINQQSGNAGVDNTTTAALMVDATPCYAGALLIPFQGGLNGIALGLRSFSVNGQFVTINATSNSTANTLNGSYSVSGGCSDGVAGTISGLKYATVSGTYSSAIGSAASASTLQLKLSQNTKGAGNGSFLITGTAVFAGSSCLANTSLSTLTGSTIIGNTVSLTFNTGVASGPVVSMIGTINQAADTMTLTSVVISGGPCSGSLGGITLKLL